MSGPITASFSFAPGGAIGLAALALQEAHQMGREYQEVLEELKTRTQALAHTRQVAQLARIEERHVLRNRVLQSESQLVRLRELLVGVEAAAGAQFEHGPSLAMRASADRWTEDARQYIQAMQTEAVRIQVFIGQYHRSLQSIASEQTLEEMPPIEQTLHIYMMHRALHAQLDPAQSESLRQQAARILGRLELAQGEPVPLALDQLAQSIVLAPNRERAESLSMELRLQVQTLRDARALQQAGIQEAHSFLAALGEDVSPALQQMLEDVATGERLMDETLRELALTTVQAVQAKNKQLQEEAAAQVLQQALRDLGYEVEGIENTFFIDGGVAHFQRQGWDEYFVRMRVDVQDQALNFNVVRAKGAQDTSERRRLDTLAEDRWCSEFPKLLETLAARGLTLNVQRLLGAGELPVQVVEATTLPAAKPSVNYAAPVKLQERKR